MSFLNKLFGSPVPTINVNQAASQLNNGTKPFLLDVRNPDEYSSGHISGAKLIPLHELTARMNELPKNREILCVCRSGNRSGTATRQLIAAGYTAVNVGGGISAWAHAGLPIKKGSAR